MAVFRNSDFQLHVLPATIRCGLRGSDRSIHSSTPLISTPIGNNGLLDFLIFSSFANLLSTLGISTPMNFVHNTGASILAPFSNSKA
jgi:hypothetical protein